MYSPDDYTVGWICTLPLEVAAAKVMLDHIHADVPADSNTSDASSYVLGSLSDHNVVLAYPPFGLHPTTSIVTIIAQMRAKFKFIRFSLILGVGGGVPGTKEDIFLGDVVVSKPTAARPGLIQYDIEVEEGAKEKIFSSTGVMSKPSTLLLTAAGKVETNTILGESQITRYITDIIQHDPSTYSYPGIDMDILFNPDYDHIVDSAETTSLNHNICSHCSPNKIRSRPPRTRDPKVHYGLIASSTKLMRHGLTRDRLARDHAILCFDTVVAGLMDTTQCLIIHGICDYADAHSNTLWRGYAAAAAAAYAKEMLLLIPAAPKAVSLSADTYAVAATVLDALLLTRPEVDRSSLIALKGRRAQGTCEWLTEHASYRNWSKGTGSPLLWISGGPGKGKTMLAIYITEMLQPMIDSANGVLLYYFCSNRDKNRNTAVTIMRGIIHQWLTFHPHLAQHLKNHFEGSESTKYTISSFVSLWRLFLTLLHQSRSCQVVCVLDGLDECEKESLKLLLNALGDYSSKYDDAQISNLKLILLSRPQPSLLENKLGQSHRIRLDDSETEVGKDVEKYIYAKVAELESEQNLSETMLFEIRQALIAGAEGTFLWVGFVADELKGRSWVKIQEILRRVPKGLGGIYQRLLRQVEEKEKLIPILQWIVLAARPLTVDELAVAADIKAADGLKPTEVAKNLLTSCGLLVKIDGGVVNLVHESAKEFFQSDQVNVQGISMFYMNHDTHLALMRICLALIEGSYNGPGSISNASLHNGLLSYAGLYWHEHFRHASSAIRNPAEFSRPFFEPESPVREDWWKFYWEQEKYGGTPPTFTLLHLCAYLGNLFWARILLDMCASDRTSRRRLNSRKDNYGRTPFFWAATRGHKDMAELLLDNGARINSKDRSKLTALHIAVTGEHKDVVSLLLDRSASLEGKASYGDTPLIRAIQANSKDIVKLLLERGARVDKLPKPPGASGFKGLHEPVDDRAQQLLGLQEQLFAARYEESSRLVGLTIKTLTLSFHVPPIHQLVRLYLKYSSIGRWEVMHVLQDLVKNNKTARLRNWAQAYIEFGTQLVQAKDPKNLRIMTGLSVQIFQVVSTADLEALLVIGVLVGSSVILAAALRGWREGVDISARTFAQFASLAYRRDAGESLHYGVREFLVDFDGCIQSDKRAENVARTVVLFSTHFAIIDAQDTRPIEYFSTIIAEYYEGFIGGSYEEHLFGDATRACANELRAISEGRDSSRLLCFLTAIFQFANRAGEKGQDRFLSMPPASCLSLCQDDDPSSHQWLIAEAVPMAMSALVSQQEKASVRMRGYKALVECLIIGRQYGLWMPVVLRQLVKQDLAIIEGVDWMLDQINDS